MNECCENCMYFHRLKHNFRQGIGFELGNCCDVLMHLDDGEEGWIQQVPYSGMCEMFKGKENDNS